jgi:hypothetical protein
MNYLIINGIKTLLTASTMSFISTLGKDAIISTLSITTNSVISVSKYILNIDKPYFNDIKNNLENTDIYNTTLVINEIIGEQEKKQDMNNSIKRAIMGVNDILAKIDIELKTIQDEMNKHEKKFFKSLSKFNCTENINNILKYEKILMKRYDLLKDCLTIN